jgi:hypothetical protein
VSAADIQAKLAEKRAAKEEREAARVAEGVHKELLILELEEKLEKELGARGSFFEIVDTVEGPIALMLGAAVLHTRFQASKVTDQDIHDYVFPCVVHPEKEKYLEIVGRRPGVALRCANALAILYGAKANADAGKY